MPPVEPPPHDTAAGSALSLATSSASVRYGPSAGTTTSSYSPVSRASGVTSASVTGALLVKIAPSITSPPTRMASPRFFSLVTNWARPIVPPAPAMFLTWMPR